MKLWGTRRERGVEGRLPGRLPGLLGPFVLLPLEPLLLSPRQLLLARLFLFLLWCLLFGDVFSLFAGESSSSSPVRSTVCMIEDALVKSDEDAAPLDTSASARLADWNDPPGLFHPAPEAVVKLEPPPRDTGAAGGSSFATGGVSGLGLGLGAAPAKPKPANERAERDASEDELLHRIWREI